MKLAIGLHVRGGDGAWLKPLDQIPGFLEAENAIIRAERDALRAELERAQQERDGYRAERWIWGSIIVELIVCLIIAMGVR